MNRALLVVLLAGMPATLLAPLRTARAQAVVNVSVNGTAAGAPLERVWPFHGYDEINYTTVPEGQALLRTITAAHTAPVHVRSHFLFNTGDGTPAMKWGSTNVYTEDAAGQPVYSWALTDGIMDSLTAAGAFPFVELGFMPQTLSTHPNPYRNANTLSLEGGCFYPPNDYTKWAGLIQTWAAHANDRYPNVEASWLWELWNEPDIGYWHGTFAEYAQLYDYTEAALHQALPDAALGGPAVVDPSGTFLMQFLQHCATDTNAVTGQTGTRLDLVTFHAKGGVALTGDHVELDLGNQLRLHRAGFEAVAAFPQFKQTPIYITEADPDGCAACPVSTTPEDSYRTSTAYGAYEVAMMKRTLELEARTGVNVGGVLTWAFTFPGTPYFAGYRTLASNGINLPVLSAFELLGRLQGDRLPVTSSGARTLDDLLANGVRDQPDVDGMATRDGDSIQVLMWNYHDDIVAVAASPVHLVIALPASFGNRARVSHLRVDESHGDAYTSWVSQGMPENPSADQLAALQQSMTPAPLSADETVAVTASGAIALDFQLPRFGVSLITVTPTEGDPTAGSPPPQSGGGCACGFAGTAGDTTPSLGLSIVVLVLAVRRRRADLARAGDRQGGAEKSQGGPAPPSTAM